MTVFDLHNILTVKITGSIFFPFRIRIFDIFNEETMQPTACRTFTFRHFLRNTTGVGILAPYHIVWICKVFVDYYRVLKYLRLQSVS
jgi:hypothetical protein